MRVAFHTLGCKVNQYETEAMKEAFVSRGAEIVSEDDIADIYIVNTCTVTNIADRKSRQYIRRMKGLNPEAFVAVTGCYAQVEPEEVAALPEVDLVIGNGRKAELCGEVLKRLEAKQADGSLKGDQVKGADASGLMGDQPKGTDASGLECDPHKDGGAFAVGKADILVMPRNELTQFEDMGLVASSESDMTRAYIKIQEGCDRFCAYCLIPFARGPVRSRSPEEIVKEATMLLDSGYKELVLTGINTALYGTEPDFSYDLYDPSGSVLPGLEQLAEMSPAERADFSPMEMILARLDAIDRDFRIRLSSLEPTVVDKEHVEKIIRYKKLCHHLHLSVQSGSSSVLKTMNRRYSKEDYLDIVKAIREYDPLYGITSDVIVGFSGESDLDFQDSMDIVEKSEFAKTHIFRYSPRRGTVGENLPDAVSGNVKADRATALAELAERAAKKFFEKNFDSLHTVLLEERIDNYVTGYTGNYIRVYIEDANNQLAIGSFCNVELTESFKDGCKARLAIR